MALVYEGVILENLFLAQEWRNRRVLREEYRAGIGEQPAGVTQGVSSDTYNEYRRGRDSACVDIVLVTHLENGTPAVLMSLRNPGVCFGGKWWIYGGALQAYMSIEEFISARATKECGVPVKPEVLIGVYRTIAEDHIGSTLQPCYAARVPIEVIRAKMSTDEGHSNVRLFTISDLILLEGQHGPEYHWYPVRVALLALRNMPK